MLYYLVAQVENTHARVFIARAYRVRYNIPCVCLRINRRLRRTHDFPSRAGASARDLPGIEGTFPRICLPCTTACRLERYSPGPRAHTVDARVFGRKMRRRACEASRVASLPNELYPEELCIQASMLTPRRACAHRATV